MPFTTTATELQRNYRRVVKQAKKVGGPVVILSNNKPEGIYVDYEVFKNEYARRVNRGTKKVSGKKKGIKRLFGSWTDEQAEQFDRVIEDAFEQLNPEDWK